MDLAQHLGWFTVANQHLPHQHRIGTTFVGLDGVVHAEDSRLSHLDGILWQFAKQGAEDGPVDFEGLEISGVHPDDSGIKGRCPSSLLCTSTKGVMPSSVARS